MGNSHSGRSRTSGTKTHLYKRKPSMVFSRISLVCGAGGSSIHSSSESEPSIETYKLVLNEKFVQSDDIELQKQSLLAYSPTLVNLNLDENGEVAFQEFLKDYPGDHCSPAMTLKLTSSIRISIDMDSRHASPIWLYQTGAYRWNLCWLHGRSSVPWELDQGPHWFPQS